MKKEVKKEIDAVNKEAVEKMISADPVVIDAKLAIDVIPGITKKTILHAGPPVEWVRMCGPQKGGVIGALLYEGLAETPEEAIEMAESGEIKLEPCHHHNTVGSMTGITSPSMWVWVIRNRQLGNLAFSTVYEGRGKTLVFGCYGEETIQKLRWMKDFIGPTLEAAMKEAEEIALKGVIARALMMGDECHNRNVAGSLLFADAIAPYFFKADLDKDTIAQVLKYLTDVQTNFFLTLSMAACKATADAAHGVKNSTIVTTMARNGVDFGIRVSGLGDEWFTAPAPVIKGLYFPGFSAEDANPDLGDSAITETAGLGGFAMAAAPAIVGLVGGAAEDAVRFTQEMREITVATNKNFQIPYLNFEGTPTGIDVRKAIEKNLFPIINTGIAHKNPTKGGHIGGGLNRAPADCFKKALVRLAEKLGVA